MVMTTGKPWRQLNIDVSNALRKDIEFDDIRARSDFANRPSGIWNFADDKITDLLCEDWVEDFSSLGFDLKNVLVFHRQPGFQAENVHVDMQGSIDPRPAVYALNWLTDPTPDSKMVWYELPSSSGNLYTDHEYGLPTVYAASWPLSLMHGNELDSAVIADKLTLVRVGLPHTVIMGERPRWCISLRLQRKYDIKSWTDALHLFRNYIKE